MTHTTNVYLLWGRVPGADNDTTHVIAADDTQEAEQQFTALLSDEYSERDLTAVFNAHGTFVFINGCERLGSLIEVNGEKLIRPDPAMICGI